jgi:DNA replication and repair protein RecF
MRLTRLSVDGFRNLHDVVLEPHPRLTVLVGDNGQGKTNLLEAIHLVSALRPLRPLEKASELVAFGRERGLVQGRFELDGPLDVEVVVEPRGRRASIGGKAVRDVAALASRLGVVSFVPEDSAIVRGSPGDRRRGLDRFAFGLLPAFSVASRRFEHALDQRNRLLKEPVVDEDALAAFTSPYVDAAVELTRLRREAVRRWAPAFSAEALAIGDEGLLATMTYRSGILADVRALESGERGEVDEYEEDDVSAVAADELEGNEPVVLRDRLLERLARGRFQERRRRTTLCGPQHDDLVLLKGGRLARFLASQGEARALVLALKLAAVRVYGQARATAPVVLLDDIAGELDRTRADRVFSAIEDTQAQCFVTTTSIETLPRLGEGSVVTIRAGALSTMA